MAKRRENKLCDLGVSIDISHTSISAVLSADHYMTFTRIVT